MSGRVLCGSKWRTMDKKNAECARCVCVCGCIAHELIHSAFVPSNEIFANGSESTDRHHLHHYEKHHPRLYTGNALHSLTHTYK